MNSAAGSSPREQLTWEKLFSFQGRADKIIIRHLKTSISTTVAKYIFYCLIFFFTLIHNELPKQILTIVRLFTFHARQTPYDKCSVFLKLSSDISLKEIISVNQMNPLPTSFNNFFLKSSMG